jgi:hypothetical protein
MAASPWTLVNSALTNALNGGFDFDSDTWKLALFLSTSNLGVGSTTFAGVTNEHAAANGYSAGGVAITCSLSGTTTVTVDFSDASFTASGGSIVARFAAIYEVGGNVLAFCTLDATPADKTVPTGETFEVRIPTGVFQIAPA